MKEKRLSLSGEDVESKSLIIQRKFIETSLYRDAGVIACYISFNGEVKTDVIIKRALSDGKLIAVPRVESEDVSIDFILISGGEDFSQGTYGLWEPAFSENRVCKVSDVDLFVVPGLAFDLNGNRLGMGKGYFDRALADVSRDKVVGLAYDFQLIETVPFCSHDVKAGYIVTEERFVDTL